MTCLSGLIRSKDRRFGVRSASWELAGGGTAEAEESSLARSMKTDGKSKVCARTRGFATTRV